MKESDYLKLKAIEDWLLDDSLEEEKKTIEHNGTISVIVKSGQWWRIFTTESFSIRALVVHLNRYCPDYSIEGIRYGEYPLDIIDNRQWRKINKEDFPVLLPYLIPFSKFLGTKEAILGSNCQYRDAINIYYVACSQNRQYPPKRPFTGVPVEHIPFEAAVAYGTVIDHPIFVSDEESVYAEPSDILKHYDGKRIERTVRGKKVKGYLIERCRLEYKRGNGRRNGR